MENSRSYFLQKILGRTKEHYLILTTSVISTLPIKHTDITRGYTGIRKEAIRFFFQIDPFLNMSTSRPVFLKLCETADR